MPARDRAITWTSRWADGHGLDDAPRVRSVRPQSLCAWRPARDMAVATRERPGVLAPAAIGAGVLGDHEALGRAGRLSRHRYVHLLRRHLDHGPRAHGHGLTRLPNDAGDAGHHRSSTPYQAPDPG